MPLFYPYTKLPCRPHSGLLALQLMNQNPEMAHILNNPALLRESLNLAANPSLMREQMRHSDRAMSNLEAHPEGFNALRRMYENIQVALSSNLDTFLLIWQEAFSALQTVFHTPPLIPPSSDLPVPFPAASCGKLAATLKAAFLTQLLMAQRLSSLLITRAPNRRQHLYRRNNVWPLAGTSAECDLRGECSWIQPLCFAAAKSTASHRGGHTAGRGGC